MTKKKIIVLVACILAVVLAVTATVVTLVIVNKGKDTPQLHFENNQLTLEVGQTVALRPVYPKKSSAPVWTSRNEAVATVDDSGNVTAHAIGTAVMKLSVTVGEETQTALCRVTVAERGAEAVGKMVISQSGVSVFAGETYTLSAYLQFGAERFGDVEWATDHPEICTVDGGVITGVSQGTATVTARYTHNGVQYAVGATVTVAAKLQTLVFDLKNDYLVRGENTELSVYLVKDGKAEKIDNDRVLYTVDDPTVAEIVGNRINGLALGQVRLTATAVTEIGETSSTVTLDVLRYCNVNYMVEGSVFATERVLNTKTAELPLRTPLLEGYVFSEWLLNGTAFTADTVISDDVNVVAGWYKVGGDGAYVRDTVIRTYPDNIGFIHDGSGEEVMEDGSFKVNIQKDGKWDYVVIIPAFDFAGQRVTQFSLALNYANLPWGLTLNGTALTVTSHNADGHAVYDFVIYATEDGGAKLLNGDVAVTMTPAQASGDEGLTFGITRPEGSTYAQCVISPMYLHAFDYRAMLRDKAALLAAMTADSDKIEYFGYYVNYFDSLAVATPYERMNITVPDGVLHAKELLSGEYTLLDMVNSTNGLIANRSDGVGASISRDLFGAFAGTLIDPGANSGRYTVYMPKIQYRLFTSIRFTCANMQEQDGVSIGFTSEQTMQSTNGKIVTVTVQCVDGVWVATMTAEGAAPISVTLSESVLNGEEALSFEFSGAPYQRLYIGNVVAAMQ